MRALIVGASGFNGHALTRRLLAEGHRVRGLVRNPATAPAELDDVVRGDVITGAGLEHALDGIDVAYYFVHSLEPGVGSADDRDLRAARTFTRAAHTVGLPRAVYLTTLAPPPDKSPPPYQRNRLAVEQVLRGGVTDTVVLRSGLVLGAGSRSLRTYLRLVQRLPVVPLGPWRHHRIAVVDTETVQACLLAAATDCGPGSWDIPASASPTHEEFVRALIDILDLRRAVIGLPTTSTEVESRLMAAITGESPQFCRIFLSTNTLDYLAAPHRLVPFGNIRPRPMIESLRTAVLEWTELPRYSYS